MSYLERDCTVYVAKTKALISFAVNAKLISAFVFAYAKSQFSHDAAHIYVGTTVGYTLSIKLNFENDCRYSLSEPR